MPRAMSVRSFRLGNRVKWTSASAGSTKTKIGTIVAVFPPDRGGRAIVVKEVTWRANACTHRSACGGSLPRDHESYLVGVRGQRTNPGPFCTGPKWPAWGQLHRGEVRDEETG